MKNFHGRLTTVDAIEDMYTRYKKAVSNGEDKGRNIIKYLICIDQ